jgi:hypothetical protein
VRDAVQRPLDRHGDPLLDLLRCMTRVQADDDDLRIGNVRQRFELS